MTGVLLAALGLALGCILVLAWQERDRRALRELARVVRLHPIGTAAPTDVSVGVVHDDVQPTLTDQ